MPDAIESECLPGNLPSTNLLSATDKCNSNGATRSRLNTSSSEGEGVDRRGLITIARETLVIAARGRISSSPSACVFVPCDPLESKGQLTVDGNSPSAPHTLRMQRNRARRERREARTSSISFNLKGTFNDTLPRKREKDREREVLGRCESMADNS